MAPTPDRRPVVNERINEGANVERSEVNAGRDATIVGRDQINIGDHSFHVNVSPPPSAATVDELVRALEANRKALADDGQGLEDLVAAGYDMDDSRVDAAIRNTLTALRNIEVLVPEIKLRGGRASFLPGDGRVVEHIDNLVSRGKARWEEESRRKDEERRREEEKKLEEERRSFEKENRILAAVVIALVIFVFIVIAVNH